MAIELCKESVRETNEHTEQRRELINRLVQLRMKLLEIKVTLPLQKLTLDYKTLDTIGNCQRPVFLLGVISIYK